MSERLPSNPLDNAYYLSLTGEIKAKYQANQWTDEELELLYGDGTKPVADAPSTITEDRRRQERCKRMLCGGMMRAFLKPKPPKSK